MYCLGLFVYGVNMNVLLPMIRGVLLDENSLAVAYDFVRGEPRGKLTKARKGKKSKEASR